MLYQNRTFLPRPFFGIGHKGEDKMLLSNVYVWTKNRARWRFDVREILHSAYLLNLCDSALCNHYFGSQKINFWKNFRKYSEWLVSWNLCHYQQTFRSKFTAPICSGSGILLYQPERVYSKRIFKLLHVGCKLYFMFNWGIQVLV